MGSQLWPLSLRFLPFAFSSLSKRPSNHISAIAKQVKDIEIKAIGVRSALLVKARTQRPLCIKAGSASQPSFAGSGWYIFYRWKSFLEARSLLYTVYDTPVKAKRVQEHLATITFLFPEAKLRLTVKWPFIPISEEGYPISKGGYPISEGGSRRTKKTREAVAKYLLRSCSNVLLQYEKLGSRSPSYNKEGRHQMA